MFILPIIVYVNNIKLNFLFNNTPELINLYIKKKFNFKLKWNIYQKKDKQTPSIWGISNTYSPEYLSRSDADCFTDGR